MPGLQATMGAVTSEMMQSARWIEALDRQAGIIMGIFLTAGFEPIAPPMIQPADVFLDLIGEDLRARTYVFNDPDGAELCLRPDLTIPACRHYLERYPGTPAPARLAYNGSVFRYQPAGDTMLRPREIRQAGIEVFAAPDPAKAEAEILALAVEAVRAAGLRAFRIRVGDLGIFNALLDGLAMPKRWRARLRHHFWRPAAFHAQLLRLVEARHAGLRLPRELVAALQEVTSEGASDVIARHLEAHGATIAGTRTLEEIGQQIAGEIDDMRQPPLPRETAELLESYLRIQAPAPAAPAAIRDLMRGRSVDLEPAIAAYERRLALVAEEGIDLTQAQFSAAFGRAFEYYTGFVFEIVSSALGEATPLGGGGRYDTLVRAISGRAGVPAVGAALYQERLLVAVRGGRP